MDRAMNHDDVAELLGAYALDAVDPDEAALIEAHIDECPRCAAELAQHHEVAALMANAGSDASVELWDKIAARLDPPGDPPPTAAVLDAALADALPRRLSQTAPAGPVVGCRPPSVPSPPPSSPCWPSRSVISTTVSASSTNRAWRRPCRRPCRTPGPTGWPCRSTSQRGTTVADIVVLPSGSGYVFDNRLQRLALGPDVPAVGPRTATGPSRSASSATDPAEVAFTQGSGTAITAYAVTAEQAGGAVAPTHSPVAESGPLRT